MYKLFVLFANPAVVEAVYMVPSVAHKLHLKIILLENAVRVKQINHATQCFVSFTSGEYECLREENWEAYSAV